MANSDDAYARELSRAYIQFKLERQKARNGPSPLRTNVERRPLRPLRPRNDSQFAASQVVSELPPALDIRKPRSGERRSDSSASGSVDGRIEDGNRSRSSSSPLRPISADPVLTTNSLSKQVRELTERMASATTERNLENGKVSRKKGKSGGFRISRAGRRIHSSLPDVAEEDEPSSSRSRKSLASSARYSRSEENLRDLADRVRHQFSHANTEHLRKTEPLPPRPQGSARMVDSLLRLQHMNESLLAHLKKMMSAYSDIKSTLESSQTFFQQNLAKSEQTIQDKDSEIEALRKSVDEHKESVEIWETQKQEDGARSQLIEIKLAQAISRISKLQRENDDLKSASSARSENLQASEKSMMRRIMELEKDLTKERNKNEEMERISVSLTEKDLEIKLLRERVEQPTESFGSAKQPKLSELQFRVSGLSENIAVLEKQITIKDEHIKNLEMDLLQKDKESRSILQRNSELQKELDAKSDSARFREKFSTFQKELQTHLGKIAVLEQERDDQKSELRLIQQEIQEKTWRIEKLQKDLERVAKEKDRAYERISEAREECNLERVNDQKNYDGKLRALKDELDGFKERCKDAEKQVAKLRVAQEEQSARHREERRELEVRLDEVASVNKHYRNQLEEITAELMAIETPND